MSPVPVTQRDRLRDLLIQSPIARAQELRDAGVAPATISRAVKDGEIERIGRGLYQQPEAPIDGAHALAETAKRIPKGVIAMVSALAYHGLTDQMPRRVWVAIGTSDWAPTTIHPPLKIVRFADKYLRQGVTHHKISGIDVPIYSVPKTLADLFRNPRLADRSVAIEGLRSALDQRKASPSEIAEAAVAGGAWKAMKPYMEALTAHG
jgi:predicted transcriptional regulator of viral defense system